MKGNVAFLQHSKRFYVGLCATGQSAWQHHDKTMKCTSKHYRFTMNGFSSELVSLSKPVQVTDNNKTTLAYYEIYPFSVHY
jgi:hypothetical protein